jgi:hypothetical protein
LGHLQKLFVHLKLLELFLSLGKLLNQCPRIGECWLALGALVHHHVEPAIAYIVTSHVT